MKHPITRTMCTLCEPWIAGFTRGTGAKSFTFLANVNLAHLNLYNSHACACA